MPRRRRSVFAGPSYGRSAMWPEPGAPPARPVRIGPPLLALLAPRPSPRPWPTSCSPSDKDRRLDTGREFAAAWAKGDREAMWRLVDEQTRKRYPLKRSATYRASDRAATVAAVRTGAVEPAAIATACSCRSRSARGSSAPGGERSRCRW